MWAFEGVAAVDDLVYPSDRSHPQCSTLIAKARVGKLHLLEKGLKLFARQHKQVGGPGKVAHQQIGDALAEP